MKTPSLNDFKDYFLVGAAILAFGTLISLPFTVGISMIANEDMSLPALLALLFLDFLFRSTAMGYIAFKLYIGDDN